MKPPARVRKAPAQVVQTAQRAAAATLRAASSGYKELGAGETPYRADFKRGIEATVDKAGGKPPQRNQAQELVFEDAPTFRPVFEPSQVIRQGAFGGTYWRPIVSGVTGEAIKDAWKEFPDDWFKGVPAKLLTASWPRYDAAVNRYGVKCGGSLDMWESSGWISNIDPYGWFQWYCRFFLGRRSSDDARQIQRWNSVAGPGGRFKNQLIGRCARASTTHDDATISPVIRQSLLHWGYELSEKHAAAYVKKKKLPTLKPAASKVDFRTLGLAVGSKPSNQTGKVGTGKKAAAGAKPTGKTPASKSKQPASSKRKAPAAAATSSTKKRAKK